MGVLMIVIGSVLALLGMSALIYFTTPRDDGGVYSYWEAVGLTALTLVAIPVVCAIVFFPFWMIYEGISRL